MLAVLVLGDSIACGDEAGKPSLGWVSLVCDELDGEVRLRNLSQGGNTISDARRMLELVRGNTYDLTLLAVGVNDATQKLSTRRFERDLRWIEKNARGGLVTVAPLQPTNGNVLPYARLLRSCGRVADVTAAWPGEHLLANGVNHPNAEGHRLYADVVLAALRSYEAVCHQKSSADCVLA